MKYGEIRRVGKDWSGTWHPGLVWVRLQTKTNSVALSQSSGEELWHVLWKAITNWTTSWHLWACNAGRTQGRHLCREGFVAIFYCCRNQQVLMVSRDLLGQPRTSRLLRARLRTARSEPMPSPGPTESFYTLSSLLSQFYPLSFILSWLVTPLWNAFAPWRLYLWFLIIPNSAYRSQTPHSSHRPSPSRHLPYSSFPFVCCSVVLFVLLYLL